MTERNQQNYLTDKDSGTLSGMSGKHCPMLTTPDPATGTSCTSLIGILDMLSNCWVRLMLEGCTFTAIIDKLHKSSENTLAHAATKPIYTINWKRFLQAP